MCVCSLSNPAWKAHAPYCTVICDLSGSTAFFPLYLTKDTVAGKKLLTINLYSNIFYNFCLNYFSLWDEYSEILSQMYIGLHLNCPPFWSDFNETWFFRQIFEKSPNIKFHEIRPEVANFFHADGWKERQTNGRTEKLKDGQRDMRNLIVAYRNFGNPPKNVTITPASKYALFHAIQ